MIDVPTPSLLAHASGLKGAVVLITGAAAGFGKGAALVAAQHGALVVVTDVNNELLGRTVQEITAAGGSCTSPLEPTDVTSSSSLRAAFEHTVNIYGRPPDVVFVNAGVAANDQFEEEMEIAATSTKPAHPHPPKKTTLSINLFGAISTAEITREFWATHPSAQDGQGGDVRRRLVLLASMGGLQGIPLASLYSATKHGVLAYWQATCNELRRGELHFECWVICPFFAKTAILRRATLIALAGIPLVPIDTVVGSMIYAASRPSETESSSTGPSPGAAMLLMDDGDPVLAVPSECDPLGHEWGVAMHGRAARNTAWVTSGWWAKWWRDIAENAYGTTPAVLAVKVAMVSSREAKNPMQLTCADPRVHGRPDGCGHYASAEDAGVGHDLSRRGVRVY